jgi:Protein of unknown function (DUF2442)
MAIRDEFTLANARAHKRQATHPRAVAARYDPCGNRVVVSLSNDVDLSFPPHAAQGLETATPSDLDTIDISPSGFGLHFPKLDADLYVPGLLEGFLGSERWMAARLGERGGKARTAAKAIASRKNGKLGGRPRSKSAVKHSREASTTRMRSKTGPAGS